MLFTQWMNGERDKNKITCPSLDAQIAIEFLQHYLLGENWYIVDPLCNAQANVEVVHTILYKYSKKYRKEYKQWQKQLKKERG